jgi:hypothetical protein
MPRSRGFFILLSTMLLAGFIGASRTGWAQEESSAAAEASADSAPAGKTRRGGSKTTTLNFEDELIQGEAKKPELFYLLERKQFNFKKLIKLREDFLPEMRRTSEKLRRGGGGD